MFTRLLAALALISTASAQTITTRTLDTGSGATTGQNISHATIGGCPAVSYSETVLPDPLSEGRTQRILFARNTLADGSGTWVTNVVHTGSYNPNTSQSSLLEIDGKPAIALFKSDGLWLAKSTTTDGSGAWGFTRISALTSSGPLDSAILDGNPAVVFRDSGLLEIARCNTPDGTSTWQVNQIDASESGFYEDGQIQGSISLAIVDGNPAVAYRTEAGAIDAGDFTDFTTSRLRYARCATTDGSGAWTVTQVHEAAYVDNDTYYQNSLAVIDGKPSIAFYHAGDLYYSRASTSDGSAAWSTTAIETAGTTGSYPTLLTVSGFPAISYYKSTGTDLRLTRCDAADGTGTWTPVAVQTTGSVGSHAAMILAAGNPAIAYFDATNFGIQWTRNSMPDASGTWSVTLLDDGSDAGMVGRYARLTKIGGNPSITHFDALATTYGRAKFARATDASGAVTGWTSIASSSIPAGYTDLTAYEINGLPAIPNFSTANKFSLLKNSAADGSGTWTTTIVDPTNAYLHKSNLTPIAGYPAIAYAGTDGATNNTLKLATNISTDGSGTWNLVTLTGHLTIESPILAEIGGCPAMVCRDPSFGLKFLRNSAADGSGTWTSSTFSDSTSSILSLFESGGLPAVVFNRYDPADLQYHSYFAVNSAIDGSGTWTETDFFTWTGTDYNNGAATFSFIDGHPAITYVSGSARELRLHRSTTTSFSGPWETWIIDASTATSGPSMLDLGGGTAGIAYQDFTRRALKYAHLDFSSASLSALKIEKDGAIAIPGNIHAVFAETTIHTSAVAQIFTLTNTGGVPLEITGISLSGTDAAQFTLTGAPTTLAPAASTAFTLGYAPDSSAASIHFATLTLTSNDAIHPSISIFLTGVPLAMDLLQT